MNQKDVLEFVQENQVRFIKLGFCDPFGAQKNISILAEELEGAFEHGISFDGWAIPGFVQAGQSDLVLVPDPNTLSVLPWRHGPGAVLRMYCDIQKPDGTSFVSDTRPLLKGAVDRLAEKGFSCKIGTECEFYLFQTEEDGTPTWKTLDQGGYLDIPPLDKGENIRRDICLCLAEMGLNPERSHHEQGPGQNEIDFQYGDPLTAADHFLTFKSVVKSIASRSGLYASFLPKPFSDESGSGLHVNLSLYRDGKNLFSDATSVVVKEQFIAGILDKIREITLFLNPLINSYDRFGECEAPQYISWSPGNRSQLIRIPAAQGDRARMELRSPDSSLNPYLAFALLLHAGLDGIERGMALQPAVCDNLYTAPERLTENIARLPRNMEEAISLAKESAFVKEHVAPEILQAYFEKKEWELTQFHAAGNKENYYAVHDFKFV